MNERALMSRVANVVNVTLFVGACAAFALGLHALGEHRDLPAIYWLVVGGISLRAATEMLRPRASGR
jgi:hypothetical protein